MARIISCLLIGTFIAISIISHATEMPEQKAFSGYVLPGPNEVHLAFSGVEVPLGRMLLIRKHSEYCALKFTRCWTDKGEKEKYAAYEVYYQSDGTGDFFNKNVKFFEGKAFCLPWRGPFYPLKWQPGKPEVKCGSLNLLWEYKGFVCFFERSDEPGEYGIELAPTPWTDIKEVDIKDPRIKWYRYDAKRKNVNIPIDKLWEEAGKKSTK